MGSVQLLRSYAAAVGATPNEARHLHRRALRSLRCVGPRRARRLTLRRARSASGEDYPWPCAAVLRGQSNL